MKNSARSRVDPFIVMDVLDAAHRAEAAGRDIVHMEIGQPGTSVPAPARAVLSRAMQDAPLGYTVALGLPPLRERLSQHYRDKYGLRVDPERIIVTAGASGAFVLAFNALFDTGARVGLGEPCYPSYRQILTALGMQPVGLPTGFETRMQPTPDQLTDDLDGLVLASPGNPAGTMLDEAALGALLARAAQKDIAVISDEIYHGLHYGAAPVSALSITDDVYVVNSFSKYFSMTGWRVGWMIVPPDHVRVVERLAQNLFICAPHASQVVALAAMDCDAELQANVAVYARNRDIMVAGLRAAGITKFAPPDGAFYVYADVSHLTDDALALSRELLDEAGIAVTPGLDFDPTRGHHFMRFSYAGPTEQIAEGMRRLQTYLKAHGQ